MSTTTAPSPAAPAAPQAAVRRTRRTSGRVHWSLAGVVALHVVLVATLAPVRTPFEDEGLYLFMGHRVLEHATTGAFLFEFPGAYFSGAPAFYPVLGALADSVGGLGAARALSTVLTSITVLAVFALGRTLYGTRAGVAAAAVFAVQGSVLYISSFATYDALMLTLVTLAAWVAARSAVRDGLLWAPVAGALLAAAALAKYAGVAYVPVVAALAVALGYPRHSRVVVTRALFLVVTMAVVAYFFLALWGASLYPGIVVTTLERHVLTPASPASIASDVWGWAGPWLVAGVAGAVVAAKRYGRWGALVTAVLLGAAVLAPLQQARIGESTSMGKHVAFGIAFVAPLVGLLADAALARAARIPRPALRRAGTAAVVLVLAAGTAVMVTGGRADGHRFMNGYVGDAAVVEALARVYPAVDGLPVLGDQPSPERYGLRGVVPPQAWRDTYSFGYGGRSGLQAMEAAVDDEYLGVVYLGFSTPQGTKLASYMRGAEGYRLAATVPRLLDGQRVGQWEVYVVADPAAAVAKARAGAREQAAKDGRRSAAEREADVARVRPPSR